MPRLKPPYPTQKGLWQKPTLMNNVETLCCVPSIILRGGDWFRAKGRNEAGSKLYCVSGHVGRPGVYELPLGATLDEVVEAAGGYVGNPRAFVPGGASTGFLPMSMRDLPLDFKSLAGVGSMLGTGGVTVLNDTVDLKWATQAQQVFFEDESCGQCAPCRIGCRIQRQALDRYIETGDAAALEHVDDVAWEMDQGSICGLGMIASAPLTSAKKHFPGGLLLMDRITLTIDGQTTEVDAGTTVLTACASLGMDVPTLCHDDRVVPAGACRMCLVEVEGQRRLQPSCAYPAADGMVVPHPQRAGQEAPADPAVDVHGRSRPRR